MCPSIEPLNRPPSLLRVTERVISHFILGADPDASVPEGGCHGRWRQVCSEGSGAPYKQAPFLSRHDWDCIRIGVPASAMSGHS